MENYSMLFPCASSSSSPPPPPQPYGGNAFLGLTPPMIVGGDHPQPAEEATAVSNDGSVMNVNDQLGGSSGSGSGSGSNNNCNGNKKKGEKKVRKARYAFQTRSQVDILDDGYRWRKYGQKAVKNNKFPRSYYRCTHQGCNVKKQVQRLTKDEGVVVTTYEGVHTHPIEKTTDNFEHILSQMQIYTPF